MRIGCSLLEGVSGLTVLVSIEGYSAEGERHSSEPNPARTSRAFFIHGAGLKR